MDDLLGEFVSSRNAAGNLDGLNPPLSTYAIGNLLDGPCTVSKGTTAQDDDDFGDFQDPETSIQSLDDYLVIASKDKTGDEDAEGQLACIPAHTTKGNQYLRCPQPGTTMDYISDNILTLPESFFSELSLIPYTSRRRVLSDARTKLWIQGVLEGGQIGQRIIRGRKRKTKGASTQDKFVVDVAAQKLSSLWSNITPRLTSLSTGSLRLKPLTLRAYNEDFVQAEACEVCATEDDEDAPILQINGLRGHQTCVALVQHMQTTQST